MRQLKITNYSKELADKLHKDWEEGIKKRAERFRKNGFPEEAVKDYIESIYGTEHGVEY